MGWARSGGYRRSKRRSHKRQEQPFDPAKHARANNQRGWDFRPKQCAECHCLFVPQYEQQTMCDGCLADLKETVDSERGA